MTDKLSVIIKNVNFISVKSLNSFEKFFTENVSFPETDANLMSENSLQKKRTYFTGWEETACGNGMWICKDNYIYLNIICSIYLFSEITAKIESPS